MRCLRFDDKKIRLQKKNSSHLYAIRETFDQVVNVSSILYTPLGFVKINEQMLEM